MQSDLVIKNVTLIPMPGETLKTSVDVSVSNSKISSIQNTGNDIDAKTVIDGTDKFLIPGLFDMHVHCHDDSFFPLFLANGVTAIRDTGNDQENIFERKQKVNSGQVLGPRMYIAGPIIEGEPPLWDGFKVVTDEEQARKAVQELKAKGVDFIKVYHTLPKNLLEAVLNEAKKQELTTTGHLSEEVGLIEALELGQNGIEHMDDITTRVSKIKSREATSKEYEGWRVFTDIIIDQAKVAELQTALKQHGTYICPTLILSDKMSRLSDYANLRREYGVDYLVSYADIDWNPSHPESAPSIRNLKPLYFDNYRLIHQANMQLLNSLTFDDNILAGSDTPNPFLVPGFSLLDELELLVEAGLKPHQALEAATYNAAKSLGSLHELGSIAENKIANMALLNSNPLDNISAVRAIVGIVLNGDYLPNNELQNKLDEIKKP